MKTKKWLGLVLLAAGFYSSAASAELLLGVKAGMVDIDVDNSDPGVNGSFQIGAEVWDLKAADISIEAEYSRSFLEPEINDHDVEFESLGVYAALRTAGPVYFIGRIGIADAEVGAVDDTDVSMGLGVGFSAGLRWEVEYTQYEVDNVDIDYITLGFSF